MTRTYNRRCLMLSDRSQAAEERRQYRREWYAKNAERLRPIHREQQRAYLARKQQKENENHA